MTLESRAKSCRSRSSPQGLAKLQQADLGMNINCQPDSLLLRSFPETSETLRLHQHAEAGGKAIREMSSENG